MARLTNIQHRRDTAANWTSAAPELYVSGGPLTTPIANLGTYNSGAWA